MQEERERRTRCFFDSFRDVCLIDGLDGDGWKEVRACGASRLDAETGLAPMSPFGVISVRRKETRLARLYLSHIA